MKPFAFCVVYPLLFCCCRQPAKKAPVAAGIWINDSTAHFRLRAQGGVRSAADLPAIGRRLEQTQGELLHLLHEDSPQHLQLFFLKDRETLTAYTAFPANGYTDTDKGIIYFVDKEPFHLAFRHEMMHALSWRLWGPPHGYWLSEGIAVFASGGCGGYPLHTLAREIQREGKLVPFENLTDTFDFKAIEPSVQGASMVQYIYDTYGVAALKRIWKEGWQSTQRATGISPDELQRGWLSCISQPQYRRAVDWSVIHASGCE